MTDVRYAIYIDAKQADAELGRLHTQAVSAAGSEKMLAEATTAATAALQAQSTATKAAAASTETFRQRVNKLPDVLGKQAAAISLVSSSLADNNGAVGKAIAGAGQLAAAYGAGGPWALALVGGLALVGQLTKHWENLNAEEERNLRLKYAGIDAAKTETDKMRAELAQLRRESDPERAREEDLQALRQRIELLDGQSKSLRVQAKVFEGLTQEQRQAKLAEAGQLEEQREILRETLALKLEIGKAGSAEGLVLGAGARRPASSAAAGLSAVDRKALLDENSELMVQTVIANQDRLDAEKAAADERELARIDAQAEAIIDRDRELNAARVASEKATNDEIERQAQESYEQQKADARSLAQTVTSAAGLVATASGQLIADLVVGQEMALERFGVTIMAQAGQALVSYGTQALGAAALSLATGNLPGAAIQGATGAALIAGGTAIGGVAASISGGFSTSPAAAERGPSTRATSTAPTGPSTSSVTYIFAPSRDEGAAAVAVAGGIGRARGFDRERIR